MAFVPAPVSSSPIPAPDPWPSAAETWRVLFEQLPLPQYVFDAATLRILAVNPAMEAAYGMSAAELLALGLPELHSPEDLPRLTEHLALPDDRRPTGLAWRHRRRDGSLIDVEIHSRRFSYAGRHARLALVRDVTERRRGQTADVQRERLLSLMAAGAPLADLMHAVAQAVEALQPGCHASVMRMDASGRTLRVAAAPSLAPDFVAAGQNLPVAVGSACCGEAACTNHRVIVPDVRRDERWRDFRAQAERAGIVACWSEPIRSRAGAVLGTLGVYRGTVHTPDAAERALVSALAQLAAIAIERQLADEALRQTQKLESLGTLAGGVAHDFNNILGAILGSVALARSESPEAAATRLDQIQKSALRARLLVQQILAFSRRQLAQPVRQPLSPLVREALELLRATLPAGVQLDVKIDEALPEVEADGTQVQQVLMNLCTNAWHAMAGAVGRIEVGARSEQIEGEAAAALAPLRAGRCAHLWVRDDGCGMDEATRARIFEPFFTTKPVGSGTGLGLAVVHSIVAEHHGAISVDSAPGRGATFHVWLPQARAEAQPARPSEPGPDGTAAGGAGRRVLLVDDDAVMLLTGEGLLKSRGWHVSTADSGLAALATLRATPEDFDLVVTDHNMPDCSGLELARLLLAVRPGLPLVICSGYIDAELRERAAAAGVRAIVQKENVVEELPGAIERALAAGTPR